MRQLYKDDDYVIFQYPSTICDFYIKGIDNMYFQKKVRFFLNYISGGLIYCLKDINADEIIGYCMISIGKAFHYNYAEINDITIGPIYIKNNYRGKRLSILLLKQVLKDNIDKREKAYAYIHVINKQSNALFSRLGFIPRYNVDIARLSRRVSISSKETTDYKLYEKDLKNCNLEI